MKRLIELSKKILQIPSDSIHGNEQLVSFLENYLNATGVTLKAQHVMQSLEGVSKRQFNLLGIIGDPLVDRKIRKGLLLLTHLDTVSSGRRENWIRTGENPYAGIEEGGRIFGRGAADAKLDFVCKMLAIQKFREAKLKQPIYLVGTCGEELGMLGARYLIQSYQLNPNLVLVGKPTDLKVITSHKGASVFKVTIGYHKVERGARGYNRRVRLISRSVAGHPAMTLDPPSALSGLLKYIALAQDSGFDLRFEKIEGGEYFNQIPDQALFEGFLISHQLEDFKRFYLEVRQNRKLDSDFELQVGGLGDSGVSFLPEALTDCLGQLHRCVQDVLKECSSEKAEAFEPSTTTACLTAIRQGPMKHELFYDVRFLPSMSIEDLHKRIGDKVKAFAPKFIDLNLTVSIERTCPPLKENPENPYVDLCGEAMSEIGLMPNIDASSLSSEAGWFSQAEFHALVFGPGNPKTDAPHGPNESISVEQMVQAVGFYEKIIEKVCL